MKIALFILGLLIGIAVGHTVTPLISHNDQLRNICPFVKRDHRDPDEVFIKFLNEKYKIIIEKREKP